MSLLPTYNKILHSISNISESRLSSCHQMIFFKRNNPQSLPMGVDIITVNMIFLELIGFYLQEQSEVDSCCKEIKKKRNFRCQTEVEARDF